jgi:hypothetical protein
LAIRPIGFLTLSSDLQAAAVPPEPLDCTVSRFRVPNTELGFAGELGFGGTDEFPPTPADWRVPELEVPNTELG